jgi:hypothetical protein
MVDHAAPVVVVSVWWLIFAGSSSAGRAGTCPR